MQFLNSLCNECLSVILLILNEDAIPMLKPFMLSFSGNLIFFRSEQSTLPGELATIFIASLEAPKIDLLYKKNDSTKFGVNNSHQISKGS